MREGPTPKKKHGPLWMRSVYTSGVCIAQLRNFIVALCKNEGQTTTTQREVAKVFTDFYDKLLSTNAKHGQIDFSIFSTGPLLSADH